MSKRVAFAGAAVLSAVVFLTFHPGLKMGFYLDDYVYLERAGRTEWSDALVQIFDPRVQTLWYRPLQAIQFFLEYNLFGGNANAYHSVNIAFHAVNVLLLYALAGRISKKWLVGLMSALFYATFSVYPSGVNWVGIVDPLAAIFYLLSIWFWWTYLERKDWQHYLLTCGSFVLALMSKQISVTVPVVLFLAEWWLQGNPLSITRLIRRYSLFVAAAAVFTLVQYTTRSTHTFAGVFGWQVGASMAFILLQYLVLFFFPWGVFPSLDLNLVEVGDARSYSWMVIAVLLLAYVTWQKRSHALLFLVAFALLNLLPVLPFPFIEQRYLYLPILATAVILALLFDQTRAILGKRSGFALATSAALGLLALGNGLAVNDSALAAAEWARQLRVPFRDIERAHPTFPKDTLLYFIDPITPTTGGLSGMFFLRYGRDISVRNWTEYAGLREHNAAYVYYFDAARRPREIQVERDAVTQSSLLLPVDYQAPIRLDGYEVPRTTIRRGDPIVLIFYWKALSQIDRNYTVFAHLIAPDGQMVAGYDSEPRKGQAPTRSWEPARLVADAILLPVGADAPAGSGYKIEVGLYDGPTQQRLTVIDARGQRIADAVVIESFNIIK